MEKSTAQIVAQARALRTLCSELAHGAAREAFVARVDDELALLAAEHVRLVVVPLDGVKDAATAALLQDLAGAAPSDDCALWSLTRHPAAETTAAGVAHRALPPAVAGCGIDRVTVLADPARVFASPLLLGRVIESCDVVLLAGRGGAADAVVVGGIRRLAEAARHVLRFGAAEDDPLLARLDGAFRECRPCARADTDASWIAALERLLPLEARAAALADASAGRLALCADLLNKHVQAEVALLKFRVADMVRVRRGEDALEPGGDPREQAEMLKGTLQAWTESCNEDLARTAEQGVLPFDSRLLANRLTSHDLLHREERAPAVIKYPILGSPALHALVTHHFIVLPDPAAVERIRQNLVTSLTAQAHKDVDSLNQRAQDLVARLRANLPLYPSFANALAGLRVPALTHAAVDRPIAGVALETEAEDKFVRVGFFKRLMEGRMVASMAFSFLTMSAGVFVLFGDPSIKRGLMKFSGVIVIMMVLYFIFSLLVKGEEEKQELDEVLERVRARLNGDVARPLLKAQAAILKAYNEFVETVGESVMSAVEAVARSKTADRARIGEQRKSEDESVKTFLARRQPAAMAAAQKTTAFITALERLRAEPARPAPALAATRPSAAAAVPPAAGAAATNGAGAATPSLAERAALARTQALERAAATAAAKPMSASERLAQMKARPAGAPNGAAAAPGTAAGPGQGAPAASGASASAGAAAANAPPPGPPSLRSSHSTQPDSHASPAPAAAPGAGTTPSAVPVAHPGAAPLPSSHGPSVPAAAPLSHGPSAPAPATGPQPAVMTVLAAGAPKSAAAATPDPAAVASAAPAVPAPAGASAPGEPAAVPAAD